MKEKNFSTDRSSSPLFSERWKRISKIREYFCDGDNTKFASMLGTSVTFTSGICNGQKNAGEKLLESILVTFPEVNKVWLFFGEGSMLVDNNAAPIPEVARTCPEQEAETFSREDVRQLMQTLATLTEANKKQTEQIDRLIGLLASK